MVTVVVFVVEPVDLVGGVIIGKDGLLTGVVQSEIIEHGCTTAIFF